MNYFKINGNSYDVLVTGIEESFNILYSENTGRTMSRGARMTLDPLGTFFGHKVTIARKKGHENSFDELYNLISTPTYTGLTVEVVHNQTILKYNAYISSGSRSLKSIERNGLIKWDNLELNIIPMEAQVLPE